MRKLTAIGFAAALVIGASSTVRATSQDECAIWLCLPGGFPGGCEAAHAAFIKRITHKPKPKPPLPAFGSCAVNSSNIDYTWGFVAEFRCDDPASAMRISTEGGRSCRKPSNNEQGYEITPLWRDNILWTDVPSQGQEHRSSKFVLKSEIVHGREDEGRR